MYSRGGSAYGQQSYGGQSGYGQNLGASYSGSSIGGPDGSSQLSVASRHSSILGSSQEAEVGAYRAHPSAAAHYGSQYSSIYSSAALSSAQQVPAINAKGGGASALEGRAVYVSAVTDSPKFVASDYVSSSSHGYSHKGDHLYAEKIPEYPTLERRQFAERQSGYMARDLPSEPTGRYADSVSFNHQHQSELYDRVDQAVLLRQEQLLKAQPASLDGGTRQADYLAARGASSRHPTQELLPYGGRMDADSRSLSVLTSSYSGTHGPSILGAAPRRNVDDLIYQPSSVNPGYGVSLPPGRDYGTKGLHASLEHEYPGSASSRGGHPRVDERKDDRASYLREFDLREEERRREHLRERERDREREKERERVWLRERERERERQRMLERREKEREREREKEKERERERKRALDIKRERTPPRVSRDHRSSSLTKEGRLLRRDSPHREALHRHHSPVKEKRREYVCKVYSSSLVEVERDYLSINKRYPRLFVSPEFSKAVVTWPKRNIKLSFNTPVSFEHDFVEEGVVPEMKEELSINISPEEPEKVEHGVTLWNAKMILMSGLSRSALEELSSEKVYDDRIPNISNILRFAVLKKDHSFMAIGGPWNPTDGGNPSVDEDSLIRTVLRYAKDLTNLDLQNCRHWNRFLEIHYDRVGKDGLFSHKEVTVLFVPDLSDSLPSLDTWQAQWLSHKKAVSERERQLSLKREKSRDKKEGSKDKVTDLSSKDSEQGKSEKMKDSASSVQGIAAQKIETGDTHIEGDAAEGKGAEGDNKMDKKGANEISEGGQSSEKKEHGQTTGNQAVGTTKSVKKKIIKRIVKQKVPNKTATAVDPVSKENEKMDEDAQEQNALDISGKLAESSTDSAGNGQKEGIKKEEVAKMPQTEVNGLPLEVKAGECSEDKLTDKSDLSSAGTVKNSSGKTTIKKKIIRRVPKRKVTATQATTDAAADTKKDGDINDDKIVQAETETKNEVNQTGIENQGNAVIPSKPEVNADEDVKVTDLESVVGKLEVTEKEHPDGKRGKLKDVEKSKHEKEKDKESKDEFKSNSNKDLKEKKKPEEPPRHPGLILQTKCSRESKLRSLALSLESLLGYSDKDIEESTFELSLFAETLYEMLEYQMGCRILSFLQKLRIRFVTKRNQRKREREESEKEHDKKLPTKHLKTSELPVENESTNKPSALSVSEQDDEQVPANKGTTDNHVDEPTINDEPDEDPEEEPEEDEEMEDTSPQDDSSNKKNEEGKTGLDELEKEAGSEKDEVSAKDKNNTKAAETEPQTEKNVPGKIEAKVDPGKKEDVVDKDLLQAFRFFDRNRVGYIKVEDMRLIIHNLGKFLSHRDVKELVQSALLESNTGRDDRVLYNKLVRMSDL